MLPDETTNNFAPKDLDDLFLMAMKCPEYREKILCILYGGNFNKSKQSISVPQKNTCF